MEFDFYSFFQLLIGNMENETIPLIYYFILLIALTIFFAIRDFLLAEKVELKGENKKIKIFDFLLDLTISLVISVICVYMVKNILVSTLLGILSAIYLAPKIFPKKTKKKEEVKNNTKDDNSSNIENNVNVVINNKTEEEKLLPDFYDPNNLKLPEDITSLNQLNIIMILEMYGYISPNQKFKMITQSLFETPEEQIDKLLKMYALEDYELEEAKAILNLIRLNNRLVTKEEALHCILEVKNKMAKSEKGE